MKSSLRHFCTHLSSIHEDQFKIILKTHIQKYEDIPTEIVTNGLPKEVTPNLISMRDKAPK